MKRRAMASTVRAWGLAVTLSVLFLFGSCATAPSSRRERLWDLQALAQAPAVTWGATNGLVQELFYEGEPFHGKPTRVFAYLGRPAESGTQRRPAMVLVHGGGGKAFRAWAEHWAQRGYVSLAMDLAGNGPDGRLPDGGPDQADSVKFREFTRADAREMWTYHAVSAVVRGHSLLRSLPAVDPMRTGITGISWGGYLTCIVAGIDARFKVAVPVYGCGFLGANSFWKEGALRAMTSEARALWLKLFDPSEYLGQVGRPILFVNGTIDFAYPLDSYRKSYQLVPEKWRHVSVALDRKHGHIWTFPEVDAFVGSVLQGEPPLARIQPPILMGGRLTARLDRDVQTTEAALCFTTDSGPWQKRKWQSASASIKGHQISAELPSARPLVAFLSLTDERGAHVSSEHVELPNP